MKGRVFFARPGGVPYVIRRVTIERLTQKSNATCKTPLYVVCSVPTVQGSIEIDGLGLDQVSRQHRLPGMFGIGTAVEPGWEDRESQKRASRAGHFPCVLYFGC